MSFLTPRRHLYAGCIGYYTEFGAGLLLGSKWGEGCLGVPSHRNSLAAGALQWRGGPYEG